MSIRFHSLSALLLLAGLSLAPVAMAADAPCESDLCRSVRQSWSSVSHDTTNAAEWTKKESVKGWDATKDGASKAAHWTGKESKKDWDATKKGTSNAAHWAGKEGEKGWKATKTGAKKAAHDTATWTKKTVNDVTQ